MKSALTVAHNAGFFSCCSVRLYELIKFFNLHKNEPDILDVRNQFFFYKESPANFNQDINSLFFMQPEDKKITFERIVDYHHDYQFQPYSNLDFKGILPFIRKYFTPSTIVQEFYNFIKQKYSIDFNNTAGVYYRGNDKRTETGIGSYEEYTNKCNEILKLTPNITFLVQTDELEFRDFFCSKFKNSFFLEELPVISKDITTVMHNSLEQRNRQQLGINILGVTFLLSKLQHLITHSGNCSEWAIFYRGNVNNVHQYLKHPATAVEGAWV
jgi:hypothetical protein